MLLTQGSDGPAECARRPLSALGSKPSPLACSAGVAAPARIPALRAAQRNTCQGRCSSVCRIKGLLALSLVLPPAARGGDSVNLSPVCVWGGGGLNPSFGEGPPLPSVLLGMLPEPVRTLRVHGSPL